MCIIFTGFDDGPQRDVNFRELDVYMEKIITTLNYPSAVLPPQLNSLLELCEVNRYFAGFIGSFVRISIVEMEKIFWQKARNVFTPPALCIRVAPQLIPSP